MFVLLHRPLADPKSTSGRGEWLVFDNPVEVLEIHNLADVQDAIAYLDHQVQSQGLYAAGFLSYEASPAFDSALQVQSDCSHFPLLCFGLYQAPQLFLGFPTHLFKDATSYQLDDWKPSVSQTEFEAAIAQVKQEIAAGNTFQVNYTFRLHSQFNGSSRALFKDLMQAQPGNYAALIETDDYSICSASPELFFTRQGRQITTRPMKGTVQRGKWWQRDRQHADWLKASPKNRAENVMIVDMLRNDLGRIADLGSVKVPHLFNVEQYPTLWQMTSTVTAESDVSMAELLSALFPCASITGAPKPSTMNIIQRLECSPRKIYTGSIGYWSQSTVDSAINTNHGSSQLSPSISSQVAQFSVAIRTVVIDQSQQQAEYGVGSGIVWDSDSQAEYEECCLKTAILSHKTSDFSLLETLLWEPQKGYFLLDFHLERLQGSSRYFDFKLDLVQVQEQLTQLIETFTQSQPYRIRLIVDYQGKTTLQAVPWHPPIPSSPLRVKLAKTSVSSHQELLYHKTTDRSIYDQAKNDCSNCDDVLLWNERGEITESCIANLVMEWNGQFITPPVQSGLLPGSFRAQLLAQDKIKEQVVTIEMLQQASEFYLINSVRRWQMAQLVTEKSSDIMTPETSIKG